MGPAVAVHQRDNRRHVAAGRVAADRDLAGARGISQGQYSLATTAGLFKSIVSLIMVLSADRIAKALGESGLY